MGTLASQITSIAIVYSTVYSGADQRKYQSSASLASVRGIHRGPVNSPHKWPVRRKMCPFDDVIMRWKLCRDTAIVRQENEFENIVCKMAAILFRYQYFNSLVNTLTHYRWHKFRSSEIHNSSSCRKNLFRNNFFLSELLLWWWCVALLVFQTASFSILLVNMDIFFVIFHIRWKRHKAHASNKEILAKDQLVKCTHIWYGVGICCTWGLVCHMMTSSNGNIFGVTDHLCGEFTGHRWISRIKASDAELWCFLWSVQEQTVDKQSWSWWFETPSRSLWRQCNGSSYQGQE